MSEIDPGVPYMRAPETTPGLEPARPSGDEKITEAVIDPRWRVATIAMGSGAIPVLCLDHPRYGTLSFIIPSAEAENMSRALAKAVESALKG